MNNESARRLMIKERERREALRKAQEAEKEIPEDIPEKEAEKEIPEDMPEKEAEDTENVITDRENGDHEPDAGIE